jgi:hypothetical protein
VAATLILQSFLEAGSRIESPRIIRS